MIIIRHQIEIAAPIQVVFDAERDVDVHLRTQVGAGERAVGGRTTGRLEPGDEVEWEARHLGVRQRLRSRITAMDAPHSFRDEMVRGAFRSLVHDHRFVALGPGRTRKEDELVIVAPLGPLGWLAERLFLGRYMTQFLVKKNEAFRVLVEEMVAEPAPPYPHDAPG